MKPTPLPDAADEARYGGKAAKLSKSLKAGLPVPPGFALGVDHVEAIHAGDPAVLAPLRSHFEALGGPCAVRSSAIGEDSEGASFAGQHRTILNVREADRVAVAVLEVRASAHDESALAYRRRLGIDERPRVAVVVQRMIEADCAGVMFTRNPVDGADERVVEGAWGLGEAVVAGLVVPDHFALDRQGRVLRRRIGEKDLAVRSKADGGTVEEPVDAGLVSAPCLSDAMLGELHGLSGLCEAHFGTGLDIEWAFSGGRLYLLQCRAMTRGR